MKPVAYSYVRMSTDMQLKGDSLRRQTETSRRYAEENGLDLVESIELHDIGVSAYNGKNLSHGALGRFLALAQNGEVPRGSYLLVESLDRLSREKAQIATTLFLQILSAGVNIVTLTDGHVYKADDEANFADIIFSVVIMSRAYEESKTKSIRVGAAWENKRHLSQEVKLTKVAPLWLRLEEDRRSFAVIEERAALIRRVFEEADAGKGSYQIARDLNLRGTPTLNGSNGWHESYITKVLTSRAVLGEFQPHRYVEGKRIPSGDAVPDYFPAIIEREQFERVQVARKARRIRGSGRKGTTYVNLFSGVARCGYCNGGIRVVDKGGGPKGGVYLRCDNARRGNGCYASSWPLQQFETAFLFFVKEADLTALTNHPQREERRKSLEGQLAVVSAEIERKTSMRDRAFELLLEPSTGAAFIRQRIEGMTDELAHLQRTLAEIRGAMVIEEIDPKASAEDLRATMNQLAHTTEGSRDNRVRLADWIRRHVKELLLYPDGLDEPVQRGSKNGPRQFSVLFENGAFRTIQLLGDDPTKASYSILALEQTVVVEP